MDIPAGSLVAITGPVGCGKSALLRAVLGLYPLEKGEIRINGRRLAEIPAEERTAKIGYLPQDPFLFSGTVRENIAFGAGDTQSETRVTQATADGDSGTGSADLPGRCRYPDRRVGYPRFRRPAPAHRPGAQPGGTCIRRRGCSYWTIHSPRSTWTPKPSSSTLYARRLALKRQRINAPPSCSARIAWPPSRKPTGLSCWIRGASWNPAPIPS